MADLSSPLCPLNLLTLDQLRENPPDALLSIAVLKQLALANPGNRRV